MVNPILATIIKKAVKGSMKIQSGGASETNEQSVIKFLAMIIIVILIEFTACDMIARDKVEKLLGPSASKTQSNGTSVTTSDGSTEGFAQPNSAKLSKDQLKKYRKSVIKEIYGPLLFINFLVIVMLNKMMKKGNNNSVKQLFTVSFCVMISSIIISYMIKVVKTDKVIFFSEYIGVKGYTAKQIGIGMMTNIIFGFIDNFGLFFGMDSLDDFLNFKQNNKLESDVRSALSGGGATYDQIEGLYNPEGDLTALRTAGWGNTFSDFLGAFVGNAVGDIASTLSGVESTPIISEIVGIVIGCVLGIFIPAKMKQTKMKQSMLKKNKSL